MNIDNYKAKIDQVFDKFTPEETDIQECLSSLSLQIKKLISSMMNEVSFYVQNTNYSRDMSNTTINTALNVLNKYIATTNDEFWGERGLNSFRNKLNGTGVGKNDDYGVFCLITTGHLGICIRVLDKLNRCSNLVGNPVTMRTAEKVEDTICDMINYLIYFDLILRQKWMLDSEKTQYESMKLSMDGLGLFSRFLDDDKLNPNVMA